MLSNGGNIREVQKSEVIGFVSELSKSKAQDLLNARLRTINAGSHRPQSTMLFKQFIEDVWRPGVLSMLKPSSSRYYGVQLDCHVLPAFGSKRLCEITRADVQCFVAEKRRLAYSGSSINGMRTPLGKALQSAVEWGYVEQNAARGINIGSR